MFAPVLIKSFSKDPEFQCSSIIVHSSNNNTKIKGLQRVTPAYCQRISSASHCNDSLTYFWNGQDMVPTSFVSAAHYSEFAASGP